MAKFIIVRGNPLDGFTFIGPFDSDDDAIDYGERYIEQDMPWWSAELGEIL